MMIVVAPTVTDDGLPAVVERVSDLIEAQDGEVESFTHDSPWGHRRLAYPIQNFRDAFYVLYYFQAVPRAIGELDRELRLDSTIIRHLIVKFDPLAHREIETVPDADDSDAQVADQPDGEGDQETPAEPEVEAAADTNADTDDSDSGDEAAAEDGESEAGEVEAEAAVDGGKAEAGTEDNVADNGEDDEEEE